MHTERRTRVASVGIWKYSGLTTRICSRWEKRRLFERERLTLRHPLLFPHTFGRKTRQKWTMVVGVAPGLSSAWPHLTTSRRPLRTCMIHNGHGHQRSALAFIKGSWKHRSEQKKPYRGNTRPNEQRRPCRGYAVTLWHSVCSVTKKNARCQQV